MLGGAENLESVMGASWFYLNGHRIHDFRRARGAVLVR